MITSDPVAPARSTSEARRALLDWRSTALVALAALQPFAAFLAANASKLTEPATILVDAVLWLAGLLLAFVVARLLTRDHPPLAMAMGFVAFSLSFWNFGRWLPFEPASAGARWAALAVWTLVTVLLVRLASRLARHPLVPRFTMIFLAIWILASLGSFVLVRQEISASAPPNGYSGPSFTFRDRPDVYWFVLDEHARSDQLRRWTGYDNSWFGDELAQRGFSVSETSRSAYVQTHLSIPSTLTMDYAFTPGHDYRGEYELASEIIRGPNAVMRTFGDNGYQVVYAPDGSVEWATCDRAAADRTCVEPIGGPFAFAESRLNLARSTPIGSFELPIAHNDFDSVLDAVDGLDDDGRPRFVMAHVMSPHNPFRFAEDCSLRSEWVEGHQLTGDERAAAYANDVACLDRSFVEATDRILAEDPDAVIIVQSDHGSRLSFDWLSTTFENSSPSTFDERFSSLDAMRLPGDCRGRSIEGESIVNTFRIVFACLSGTEPELLDRRMYFSEFGRIATLAEVPESRFGTP